MDNAISLKEKNMVKIAVIHGDGIGREVMPEGLRVLEAAGRRFSLNLEWTTFPWNQEVPAKG
jgi:tartrate dehydrogenase/decarboxylase/D-malate dehydrogenase